MVSQRQRTIVAVAQCPIILRYRTARMCRLHLHMTMIGPCRNHVMTMFECMQHDSRQPILLVGDLFVGPVCTT